MKGELLIRRVRIADGRGGEPFPGEILVRNGIIAAVGAKLETACGATIIDGGGLLLTPGFIDGHGHSDISALAAPECRGKISQGFTTEICGNCGLSPFPLTEKNRDHLTELYRQYGITLNWSDCRGYLARCRERGVRMRLVPLCGHNTLRAAVAGYRQKQVNSAELHQMQTLLAQMLSQGAAGLSTGLLYTPGCFSDRQELEALLRVTAERDVVYATHLRSEGNELLEALRETFDAARTAKQHRVRISHFKTAGAANWEKLDAALALADEAERAGMDVTFDRYPYCESMTQLSLVAPGKFGAMDDVSLSAALQQETMRKDFEKQLRATERDWRNVRLISTGYAPYRTAGGRTLAEIAAERGIDPVRLAVEILAADAVGASAAFRGMSGENMKRIVRDRRTSCGTDESVRNEGYEIGRSHPRGFGSMPETMRILREGGIGLGEAVRRQTLEPARFFGLKDRGLIASGYAADLVLWDEKTFASQATYGEPHRTAQGVEAVWVLGTEQKK